MNLEELLLRHHVADITVGSEHRDWLLFYDGHTQVWYRLSTSSKGDSGLFLVPDGKAVAAIYAFNQSGCVGTVATDSHVNTPYFPSLLKGYGTEVPMLMLSYKALVPREPGTVLYRAQVDCLSQKGFRRILEKDLQAIETNGRSGVIRRHFELSTDLQGRPLLYLVVEQFSGPSGTAPQIQKVDVFKWDADRGRFALADKTSGS